MRLHLNIGSNCGFRHARIGQAVAAICSYASATGGRVHLSAPLQSDPWGYDSPNRFLNIGLRLDLPGVATPENVTELFRRLRDIEKSICPEPHRNADGTYRDREIDIDFISADSLRLDSPELQLPHSRAAERPFVLNPLLDLGGPDIREYPRDGLKSDISRDATES